MPSTTSVPTSIRLAIDLRKALQKEADAKQITLSDHISTLLSKRYTRLLIKRASMRAHKKFTGTQNNS